MHPLERGERKLNKDTLVANQVAKKNDEVDLGILIL